MQVASICIPTFDMVCSRCCAHSVVIFVCDCVTVGKKWPCAKSVPNFQLHISELKKSIPFINYSLFLTGFLCRSLYSGLEYQVSDFSVQSFVNHGSKCGSFSLKLINKTVTVNPCYRWSFLIMLHALRYVQDLMAKIVKCSICVIHPSNFVFWQLVILRSDNDNTVGWS